MFSVRETALRSTFCRKCPTQTLLLVSKRVLSRRKPLTYVFRTLSRQLSARRPTLQRVCLASMKMFTLSQLKWSVTWTYSSIARSRTVRWRELTAQPHWVVSSYHNAVVLRQRSCVSDTRRSAVTHRAWDKEGLSRVEILEWDPNSWLTL